MTIGCIGQGFIGGNYANTFEAHGYTVVRYALEEPYCENKAQIAECDIVFIAVPTPTTPDGFDASVVEDALTCVGPGKVAVIKSTVLPGTTNTLQERYPHITLLFSPEFLREASAADDAAHPERNIIGVPVDDDEHRSAAETVMGLLPEAPFSRIMSAIEAELVKYAGNNFLAMKVIYANLLYDFAHAVGADYDVVKEALGADDRIGQSHLAVVDASGHPGALPGRGAGGHCFIKDLAAFSRAYAERTDDDTGHAILGALEQKNIALLKASKKDGDLLQGVYGTIEE